MTKFLLLAVLPVLALTSALAIAKDVACDLLRACLASVGVCRHENVKPELKDATDAKGNRVLDFGGGVSGIVTKHYKTKPRGLNPAACPQCDARFSVSLAIASTGVCLLHSASLAP